MRYKDLESAILHSFASDNDLFAPCEHLAFEDIWQESHNKIIFKIIKDNHGKKFKTDLHLLKNGLIKAGYEKLEIRTILEGFHNSDSSIKSNIEKHMGIVFEVYTRRKLKPVLHKAYNELFSNNGDIDENLNTLKDAFNELDSIKNSLSKEKDIVQIYEEAFEELMTAQESTSPLIGYSYGLTELDKITCGMKQEDILVIAPPACGKSSFMVNILKHVAIKQKKPVLIFSVEMPAKELMKNIWANALEINSYGIRSGGLADENITKIKSFKNAIIECKNRGNLVIDDSPGMTWQYMETRIRRMRRDIPLNQVIVTIVDYVQIMKNIAEERKGTTKEEQQSIIANALMELSKKYNLCMIKLSQIGREVGKRDSKEPTMSDAKGSGAWEANAVIVIALFRPEYFDTNATDTDGSSLKGLAKITILKNRYGSIGHLYAKFKGHFAAFEDYHKDGLSTKDYGKADEEAF